MATLALDLGMIDPPESVAELEATIQRFRPELRLSPDGAMARDFVVRGVQRGPTRRSVNWLLVRSSFALMSPWELELLGVRALAAAQPSLRPTVDGAALSAPAALRAAATYVARLRPPSTTTT